MRSAAERMKTLRERRRDAALREVRLIVPDPRLDAVRQRLADQTARLDPKQEAEVMDWIESVSEFDSPEAQ